MLAFIGKILRYSIIIIYGIHSHIFFCIACATALFLKDEDTQERIPTLLNATGPVITTSLVVFILNHIVNVYDDIQSWEIAYILWSVICALLYYAQEILVCMKKDKDRKEVVASFDKFLLYPFGVKSSETGDSGIWSLPLVASAPAIVGGYIANYILSVHYVLECDPSYEPISNICEKDVCCIITNSDENWINFIVQLASSILASWGIVKSVGY
eukprot:UN03063